MSCHPPDLLSDDDIDSDTASEDSLSDSGDSGDENEWPVGLRNVLGNRPTSKDYDKNGLFKTTSDYYTNSDEDTREVFSVTETDPLVGDYPSNGHVSEKEANKENIAAAATAFSGSKPPAQLAGATRKKPLILEVPAYNKSDSEAQRKNIRTFYQTLLENYTDYALEDVAKKCQEFTLKKRSEVEVAVNVFYDKAVTDVAHAKPIASLCTSMEVHKIHEIHLFRETMLACCQKKFLQIRGEVNVIEEVSGGKFTDCEDLTFELQNEANLENWMKWTEVEEKMRCHMIFLGELYNFGELPIKVILGRVLKMFETKSSRHLDFLSIGGLYELLRISGPKLDIELQRTSEDVKKQYQTGIENFQELYRDKTYPAHVRDKLWLILQLKENNWRESPETTDKKAAQFKPKLTKSSSSSVATQKSGAGKVSSPAQTDFSKGVGKSAAFSKTSSGVQSTGVGSKTTTKAKLEDSASKLPTPREDTSPPSVRTTPQPLIVKPTNQPKITSNDKINNQIKDNLSKAWRNVTDGDYSQAVSYYNECLVLFNVLNTPHQHMDETLICLYVLVTQYETQDNKTDRDALYRKITSINHKTFPFVDYIHLQQLSKSCGDFKVVLTHFVRLNKAVEESWSQVFYPLSQRLLVESAQGKMRDWLKSFVSSQQLAYKDTFHKCVHVECKSPCIYIVEYEDFEPPDTYEVLECSEKCKQYYHHHCFKSLGKWNIDGQCLTPDCTGRIIRLYERRIVKRESKTPTEPKKGKEKTTVHPPSSPRPKKKGKKRQDSGTRETRDSVSEGQTVTPPAPSPSPPPAAAPLTPSPEPEFTGDDIVDMFGTMLIYLEEYPGTHLTTVVMEMNSIYSWVRVEMFNEFLDIGVQSLTISNKGELNLKPGTDMEREIRRENDVSLLIEHYKNSPISSLKQKIDQNNNEKSAETNKPKTTERKKHPSCEKQYKRLTKNSGSKADTKENNSTELKSDREQTPDLPPKQRTISGSLNPGAAVFSPPVSKLPPSLNNTYPGQLHNSTPRTASGSNSKSSADDISLKHKNAICFHCDQKGHIIDRCPKLHGCFNCGKKRHISGLCPELARAQHDRTDLKKDQKKSCGAGYVPFHNQHSTHTTPPSQSRKHLCTSPNMQVLAPEFRPRQGPQQHVPPAQIPLAHLPPAAHLRPVVHLSDLGPHSVPPHSMPPSTRNDALLNRATAMLNTPVTIGAPIRPTPEQVSYKETESVTNQASTSKSLTDDLSLMHKNAICFHCEQKGHIISRCPELRSCFNCGKERHVSGVCPEPTPVGPPNSAAPPASLINTATDAAPVYLSVSSKHPEQMRKELLEKIVELEELLEETKNKYEKEINHMKSQLVEQLDEHSRLKSKAKQYKQEAKQAQDIIEEHNKLQNKHEKILKQMEDERRNWLSERTGKSVESKKIIVTMKIEIEEANKRNRELETKCKELTKENEVLTEKLQQIESDLFSRDQSAMNLKGEVLELNRKYKGTQQQHVLERYNTAQLRLRIAYANCEAQIRERAKLENPEFYYLSLWQQCQTTIKNKIDDNSHIYQEYVSSLHNSVDMEVRFEQEPPCPAVEVDVPPLPLQRFDDILLGRPAPDLPSPASSTQQIDSELNVLADLMRDTAMGNSTMPSFMAAPDTSQPPIFPNSSQLIASTPANTATPNSHFQFSDLDIPVANPSTRPPSSGSSNTSRPPSSKPIDLADIMSRQPAPHFLIADSGTSVVSETRQPAVVDDNIPSSAIPSSAIPSSAIPSSAIPSSAIPSSAIPSSAIPSSAIPSSAIPSSAIPSSAIPSSAIPSSAIPSSAIPSSAIPSSAIPSMPEASRSSPINTVIHSTEPARPANRGRGRARNQRSGQSTVPSAVGTAAPPVGTTRPPVGTTRPPIGTSQPPPGVTSPQNIDQPAQPRAAGGQGGPVARAGAPRAAALKNRIKEKFPFLSEKEINRYLKRVKEDTDAQGIKVTPTIALQRVSELVETDYPSTPPDPTVPVVPERTCVICHEALNLMAVSQLGCGHDFHKNCVDQWFATQNHTCPTCRSHQPPVDMFPPLTR